MKVFFISILALFFMGCSTVPQYGHRLDMLTRAPRPVTVIAISRETAVIPSITFKDARGKIFVIQDEGIASMQVGLVIF